MGIPKGTPNFGKPPCQIGLATWTLALESRWLQACCAEREPQPSHLHQHLGPAFLPVLGLAGFLKLGMRVHVSGCSHKSSLHCGIRSHTDEGLAILKPSHVRQKVATLVVKILQQGPSLNNLNHTWRPLGDFKSSYGNHNWCSDPR